MSGRKEKGVAEKETEPKYKGIENIASPTNILKRDDIEFPLFCILHLSV